MQEDKVSNDKLESELERYTPLRRFIRVEDQMDTFMTRKLNDAQNINLEERMSKIWSTLDRDYFVKDEVTEKLDNMNQNIKETYCTIEEFNNSDENNDQRFRDNAKRMLGHEE